MLQSSVQLCCRLPEAGCILSESLSDNFSMWQVQVPSAWSR